MITKAITKQLSWVQASEILGISVRHMRRVRYRAHFVRCPVTVHQFADGNLGISYQSRLLGPL